VCLLAAGGKRKASEVESTPSRDKAAHARRENAVADYPYNERCPKLTAKTDFSPSWERALYALWLVHADEGMGALHSKRLWTHASGPTPLDLSARAPCPLAR
jgi:hypothetical protein